MAENVTSLLYTPLTEIIDPSIVTPILSTAPFINIPNSNLFNLRDLSDGTNAALHKGLVFRSGSLERITDEGKAALRDLLGIKTIFDLRSAREIAAFPDPVIDGVDVVAAETDTDPMQVSGFRTGSDMYLSLLAAHKDIWRKVLEHVRDHPEKPFLLHCTGGKDRTGVAAALLLGIAGAPSTYISHDYALTRIGIEPVREMLTQKLTGGKPIDLKAETKLAELMRMDPDVMEEFLKEVDDKFGGMDGYVVRELGFSDEEVEVVRKNLRVS